MGEKPLNETQVLSLADMKKEAEALIKMATGNYFTLTVIEGRDFGYVFQLDKPETVLGRKEEGSDADIQLEDIRASRRHVAFLKKQLQNDISRIIAIDLSSKNGTFLNGERVVENEVELRSGDKLQIGNSVVKFEIKDQIDLSHQQRLYEQVARDVLTGLWNHNYVRQEMEKSISTGKRHDRPFSLVMLEIDLFQSLNDTYGRTIGDSVLRAIAQTLMAELSDCDIASRYHGKQFLIMLPETEMGTAFSTGERLRLAVQSLNTEALGCNQRVTVSIGVVQFPVCGRTSDELLKHIDEALYSAKQVGGNRTIKSEVVEKKRVLSKRKVLAVALLLLVVVSIGMLVKGFYTQVGKVDEKKLTFSGTIESHEVQVGSKIGGRVTEILVTEGQAVKRGEPLVRFDIAELLAQRSLLESRIESAEAQLARFKNGNRPEEIAEAEAAARHEQAVLEGLRNGPRPQELGQVKADLDVAKSELEHAQASLLRIDKIYQAGYASKQRQDDEQTNVNSARARVESLQQKLLLLEAGTRVEEIRAAQERLQQTQMRVKILRLGTRVEEVAQSSAELNGAKAELAQLKVRIAEGEILSPADSRVEVISVRPGDLLPANQTVMKLLEEKQTWVRAYVPEPKLGKIKVGQRTDILVDAFTGKKFSGYIEHIAEEAEFYPRNVQTRTDRDHQVFSIKVHLNDGQDVLKSGMSADVVCNEN